MKRLLVPLAVLIAGCSVGCGPEEAAPRHFAGPYAFQSAVGCDMAVAEPEYEFGAELGFSCSGTPDATYPDAEGLWFANASDLAGWERMGKQLAPDTDWPRLVGDRWAVDGLDEADLRELQDQIGGTIRN